jgi:hypothetical protein
VHIVLKRLWLRSGLRIRYGDPGCSRLFIWFVIHGAWSRQVRPSDSVKPIDSLAINLDLPTGCLSSGAARGISPYGLRQVCNSLSGIDVSRRAIRRSRARCPDADFAIGDISRDDRIAGFPHVDLVVACEVLYLYYMKDIATTLKRISQLGAACFLTYYDGRRELLDPYFSKIPDSQKSAFCFGETCWRAFWWRGPWR